MTVSVVTVTADSVRRSQLDSARPNGPSLSTHEDSSPLAPRRSVAYDTDSRIVGIPRMRARSGTLCATARGSVCAHTETAVKSVLSVQQPRPGSHDVFTGMQHEER